MGSGSPSLFWLVGSKKPVVTLVGDKASFRFKRSAIDLMVAKVTLLSRKRGKQQPGSM